MDADVERQPLNQRIEWSKGDGLDSRTSTRLTLRQSFAKAQDKAQGDNVDPATLSLPRRWRGYNGLVELGYQKHLRVNHGEDEFVRGKSHINGIESFWAFAKTRLGKFRGMRPTTFYLHLKECEFRFNHRVENLYSLMLKMIRSNPLF